MLKFLKSMPVKVATLFVLVQAAVLYSSVRPEYIPQSRALAGFPLQVGAWQFLEEGVVDQETRDVLQADDLLDRTYMNPVEHREANLFIAAFRTQRNGKAPHSPKNCLPGSGWTPLASDYLTVDTGRGPITVNRYVVAHDNDRSLVLYWYQSRNRVVASEYRAKFWVMVDAIRLNRTDTALVRVVVPIANRNQADATRIAVNFVKSFFAPLHQFLPA